MKKIYREKKLKPFTSEKRIEKKNDVQECREKNWNIEKNEKE